MNSDTTSGSLAAKSASTSVPLHPLLAGRWSPRGLDQSHEVTDDQLRAVLEAARWAPSANNSQPWRFAVARRGTPLHGDLVEALNPGNKLWAPAGSALVVASAVTEGEDGSPRPWALYDTGQAVAHLTLQAEHEGLAVHQLGGFDRDAVSRLFDLPAAVTPVVVIVLGRRHEAAPLDEVLAARELAPRERLPLRALLLQR